MKRSSENLAASVAATGATAATGAEAVREWPRWAVLARWDPEDATFWEARGRAVARRNLWISIFALFLAFAVWMVWSVVVVQLPKVGFRFSTSQLFWLAALPGLSGATLRIFYSFMVPVLGGRLFTTLSTASLLVPAIGIGLAVQDLGTPYWVFLLLSLAAGFGGGNFASSMANISFFFPKKQKGAALGMNGGLGNLGVSAVQFLAPLAMGAGLFGALGGAPQQAVQGAVTKQVWLQNAAFLWVPLVAIATALAWFGMDTIAGARASFREQAPMFKRKHTWLMSWLYIGTFGSFIGYSAALPLVIKGQFPSVDPMRYAFIGPLLGALVRPVGGWLADRLGGAKVTVAVFVAMSGAALGVIASLPSHGQGGSFPAFLAMFIVLFAASGVGNGSTYRMIPVQFATFHQRRAGSDAAAQAQAGKDAAREAGAVVGFVSAVAAYGAFFVPKGFGSSIAATGGPATALFCFVAFYATCIGLTWWCYARRGADMPC